MRGNGPIYGGRYRVDRELGRGPYSISYLVTDLKTARPCVLKLLREEGVPPEDARLFEAQAAILAKLNHPRLPSFVEYFVEGEGARREHLLVTRFHPGESLERLVEKGRLLTEAQAITLLGRLAPVFTYLHGFDPPYVHRFLKPSNIILGPDGRPCLVDFHFAAEGPGWRAWESAPADEEGVAIAAPEVAVSGAVPASDIYALGMAVIYAMTGVEPERLAGEIARSRLRDTLKAGDAFAAILARMVEPSLEKRYPDARALEVDLERLGAGHGAGRSAGRPAPQPKPATDAARKPAERRGGESQGAESKGAAPAGRGGLRWAVIALAAVLAGGGLFWFRGMQRGEPAGESLLVPPPTSRPPTPPPVAPPAPAPAAAPEAAPAPGTPSVPPSEPGAPSAATATPGTGGEAAPASPATAETGTVPASAASPDAPAAAVVAEGRLLFEGKPVAALALPAPLFWFRDETTKKVAKAQVEYAAGAFTVRGLPPGRYGLSVRIDLEPGNPNIFPGDLNGWIPFTLEAGRPATLEVPLRKIIRLLQPVDNNVVLRGWEVPCGAGHPTPGRVVFAWEAVDPGASYEVRIDRLLCDRGYAVAGRAFSHITNDTWVKVDLPPNAAGECYSFRLSAVKGGRQIGVMTTHGKTGLGWDYKFSVAP